MKEGTIMSEHIVYSDEQIIESLKSAGLTQKQAEKQVEAMKQNATTIKTGGGRTADSESGRLCSMYSVNVQTGTDSDGKPKYSRKLDISNSEVINFSKKIGKAETLRLGKRLSGLQSGQNRAYQSVNADKANKGNEPFLTPNILELCDAYIEEFKALKSDAETVIANASK
jgi:hypothetical protein